MSSAEQDKPVRAETQAVGQPVNRPLTWNEVGDGFETLGKVGLALAIGMSAAGLFCRLADQGKVRVPTLSGLVLNRGEQASPPSGGGATEPREG